MVPGRQPPAGGKERPAGTFSKCRPDAPPALCRTVQAISAKADGAQEPCLEDEVRPLPVGRDANSPSKIIEVVGSWHILDQVQNSTSLSIRCIG
jgi:hypothetical protein